MSLGKSGFMRLEYKGQVLENYRYRQLDRRYKVYDDWSEKYKTDINGMFLIIAPASMKHLESEPQKQISLRKFINNERQLLRKQEIRNAERESALIKQSKIKSNLIL